MSRTQKDELSVVSLQYLRTRPLDPEVKELSDRFIKDFLMVSGLEVDDEGYIVDSEDDGIEPEYVIIKDRVLRLTNHGIIHKSDIIMDPYNNNGIMEALFIKYIKENHQDISSTNIMIYDKHPVSKTDNYGYITILFNNGAKIQTGDHYRDSTKYLDAYMRLESMTDDIIMSTLKPYDEYEKKCYIRMMDDIKAQKVMLGK